VGGRVEKKNAIKRGEGRMGEEGKELLSVQQETH